MRIALNPPSRSWALAAAVGCLASGGCGGEEAKGGADSPEGAVAAFLEPLSTPPSTRARGEAETRERARTFWSAMCDRVDPAIRKGLREGGRGMSASDARAACGSLVVLSAMYAGETSGMVGPAAISGTPRSADTHGATSVVTVDVRYRARPDVGRGYEAPPAHATIKVLAAEHDGRWWVATPEAFNATYAVHGGRTEAELRRAHAEMLAAAR